MPCGKLQSWEECLNNLKLIYEKITLKISRFLKKGYLIDYLIRTEHATEKLDCMKRCHEKHRNEWYAKHKIKCYCYGSENHKLYS